MQKRRTVRPGRLRVSAFNDAQATAANKTEQMNSAVDTNVKIKDALENSAPQATGRSTVPTTTRIDKVIDE